MIVPGKPARQRHAQILWRLTGLIDFEPAMRGAREYEFAAVSVFFAEGDAELLRRTLCFLTGTTWRRVVPAAARLVAAPPVQLPALVLPPSSRPARPDL